MVNWAHQTNPRDDRDPGVEPIGGGKAVAASGRTTCYEGQLLRIFTAHLYIALHSLSSVFPVGVGRDHDRADGN